MSNYWGNPDTSVIFCEEKYKKSIYISEFYNTLSGSLYIFAGLPFINTNIYPIAMTSIFLGIGTILLHATQRMYGQIMDELSMLTLCYFILNKVNYIYKKHFIAIIWFIYLQNHDNFVYFISIFTTMILLLLYESRKISNKKKCYRNIFIISMSTGTLFWVMDQQFCYYIQNYQFHAIWHIMTAISIYSGFKVLKK